ncbi:MAG: dihydroneopterin aldolase [Phaeodactylibacter sp.]|uniref:dihydroneopterin aldolase n=1 Tax=Phaeodactylibacter sp. TaxID=1940289 RepID=UPI0032EA99C2
MATIALEGVQFFARHGYYEEEQVLGNMFVLDVIVNAEIGLAAEMDDLYAEIEEEEIEEDEPAATTVNYELLYFICQREMKTPVRLLETVVERIANRIEEFDNVTGYLVRLRKLSPPLGGRVGSAWVMTNSGDMDLSYLELIEKLT